MSIDKKKNGKYLVDMLDEHHKRIQRTFNKMADAKGFENETDAKKYQRKMIGLGLAKLRYPIDKALNDFESTKTGLRFSSIKKNKGVISEIRKFILSLEIKYVDEIHP